MPRVTRAPRNSISDRPGRLKILWRRHRRFLRPAAIGAAALLLVGLGAEAFHAGPGGDGSVSTMRERLGAATAALGLRVRDVRIEGRANTPEPLLRAALGVTAGAPILGFSVAAARARIETLAWVEHATVERQLPGTIVVNLQERRPFAIWQNGGKFVVIDRAGQVVADQNAAGFGALPLVVGAGAATAAAPLLDALSERPTLQAHVLAAVRVGERRWNLRTDGGTDILLPEGAEVAALDRLLALERDHALLDRPLAAVDMRLPDRLVIRPQPDAVRTDGAPAHPAAPAAPAHRPT